jgi:hypothetical protein
MDGTCDIYGKEERCIQGVMGKQEGKSPLGRPMHIWAQIWILDK